MIRFAVFFTWFFILSTNLYAENKDICSQKQCLAVVDAGSTGSRLHVYAYDIDNTTTPTNIEEVYTQKVTPGFAAIEPSKDTITSYLKNLIPINVVSSSKSKPIPLYFYATAGMRLLPPQKQKIYYQELKTWFSQQSQWQLMDSKTITGHEEAFYDWLSVNYRIGSLSDAKNKAVGVMDMGGASVQIVFPLRSRQAENHNQKTVHVYGQDITLSVHSFLGLGKTEVSHQFLNSSACFSKNFTLPDGLTGRGHAGKCEKEISQLINKVHGVDQKIKPLLVTNPIHVWVALDGISKLADNKLFHFENDQLTLNELLNQADTTFCRQSWENLENQFPVDEHVHSNCLFAAYYYALIVDGYGLSPNQPIRYLPPTTGLDWTLGVVFNH